MAGARKHRQARPRNAAAEGAAKPRALKRKRVETGREKPLDMTVLGGDGDAYFRSVVANSPMAMFVRDRDFRYLLINEAYENWYDVDRRNVVGKTPYDVFRRETADQIAIYDKRVLKSGRRVARETMVTLGNGTKREQRITLFPLSNAGGKIVGVCGMLTDLGEHRRAERAARASEVRLRSAFESMHEGFALYDADDKLVAFNGRYKRFRPYAQTILDRGGNFEDMIREHVKHGMIPEALGREEAFIKERLEQRRDFKGPLIRRYVDGRWYMIDEAKTPDGGTALSIIDVTDLKETENALKRSEALFRAVVNHSPTKIHIKDVEGRYTLINKGAEKLFGVTDAEGRGKTSYDLFPKDVADAFLAHDRAVMESGKAVEGEEEFEMEDGIHTFLTVKFPIYDLDGVAAVGAIGTDITERKRAEENIRRLAAAIEGLSENFALYGPDDRLIISNRNYRQLNAETIAPDITFEEHMRAVVDRGQAPEAVGREEAYIKERLEHHRNPRGPFEVGRQDGRWFLVREQRMADGSTATIGTDITDRKRAEQELERQKTLVEAVFRDVADAMILSSIDRQVMMVNPGVERVFGYAPEEIVGKSTMILYENREEFERQGRVRYNANAEAKIEPFVVNYRRKTGELFRGETVGTPIRDRQGNTLGFIAVIRDITEREMAEEALRESEARLSNILENSPAPIYFKDTEGRFILANRQYEKRYGVKFENLRGKTSREVFGDDVGGPFFAHDRMVLDNRTMIEREEHILGRSYLTLKFPVIDPAGELLGLGGIETDVTELKNAEKELRGAKEQAEFANRAKTEFLANMSHELRTPLNSILGLSEMLANQTLGPLGSAKYGEYAQDIHASGGHLLSLISEVLDLSKIEAGELEIVEDVIDVTSAVSSCVRMIEGRLPKLAPRVDVKVPGGLPKLLGDERRIKQILLNLLGNAVKFTPTDGRVSIAARVCEHGRFTIDVADTGIGIAAEDIPKVLEPFGQVRDVFTRNHEGTGLGLYLAKSFTEMHGGELSIASRLGQGTTVTLKFPKERTVPSR